MDLESDLRKVFNGIWACPTDVVSRTAGSVEIRQRGESQANSQVTWVHQEPFTKGQRFTDASGAMTATVIEVDPFGGETARSANSAFQPRKYTSYTRDSDGSDEAMHRRYSAAWSRFSQPDPYDGSYNFTNPQSFNRSSPSKV